MTLILYLAPIDTTLPTAEPMQQKLMELFITTIDGRFDKLIRTSPIDHVCTWTGIQCEDLEVTEVKYVNRTIWRFSIDYLPQTVKRIDIYKCNQNYELHIRALPRSLESISVAKNQLWGHLDLTVLPQQLVTASFTKNRLTGPISLLNLPSSMRNLYISKNRIEQKTVWYGNLPKGLVEIQLMSMNDSNRMTAVKAVNKLDKVENPSIFRTWGKMTVD